MSSFRIAPQNADSPQGQALETDQTVAFTFDAKQYFGLKGDTLASALLANGVSIVGRSFKYHRPRGIMAAGVDEPNGLVTVLTDGVREPNVRATEIEIFEGLAVQSQNRFPSLEWDLLSLNALAGKALSAGFYYKTFMGPVIGPLKGTTFWMLCERFIRRAAGLGAAGTAPDPNTYGRMNAFCDVLVVGGGDAGMAQALQAADDGKDVILCELDPVLGGLNAAANSTLRQSVYDHANIRVLTRTTVWGYYDGNTIAAVERVTDHKRDASPGEPRQRYWTIRADHVALATGALERPIAFPGNDRPGIMLADAARQYAENFAVATGKQVVIFTNNDSAYDTADALHRCGVAIKAIIDTRPTASDRAPSIVETLECEWLQGHAVIGTEGRKALRAISVAAYNAKGDGFTGNSRAIACDSLLVSGGWSPVVHLMSQAGAKPVWDAAKQAFVPPAATGAWSAHGMAAGAFDFNTAPTLEVKVPGKSFVDFQHDVTADDVRLAHREGFISVEHLKRYTTLGMATDQGKSSNIVGLSIMADALGKPIQDVGTTRFRPPYTAASIGSIAAERYGDLFPHRLTPMHDWHVQAGARMYAAGHWDRPESYNRPGETVEQAYVREAKTVRAKAGLVDVSTLGKIDIQGPDAAEFLNRVYTNGFAKLPVGKARYGLMLREDGFAMDDGTTWRLAQSRFLMTTTTANAALVMQHLEQMLAVHWPELKVHLTSVTDQWAAMALAGPKARTVLEACVAGTEVNNDALPFMGIVRGTIDDVPVMICRLSFSGELAYEVYCGANHGPHIWQALLNAGKPHGICAYGLEALGTLRIEKGHVTAAEIDGRTTAHDLHLDWMLSTKKTYVGSAMMDRDGLRDPDRWTLVGVVSRNGQKLKGGSHLVSSADADAPGPSLGHLTAMCFSPELNQYIGLALLENGTQKIGQRLYATDPVRTQTHIPVEIVSHHMVDPTGERMHG